MWLQPYMEKREFNKIMKTLYTEFEEPALGGLCMPSFFSWSSEDQEQIRMQECNSRILRGLEVALKSSTTVFVLEDPSKRGMVGRLSCCTLHLDFSTKNQDDGIGAWVDSRGKKLSPDSRRCLNGYNLVLTLPKTMDWPPPDPNDVLNRPVGQNATMGETNSRFHQRHINSLDHDPLCSMVSLDAEVSATAVAYVDSVVAAQKVEHLCVACQAPLTGERKFCSSCGFLQEPPSS